MLSFLMLLKDLCPVCWFWNEFFFFKKETLLFIIKLQKWGESFEKWNEVSMYNIYNILYKLIQIKSQWSEPQSFLKAKKVFQNSFLFWLPLSLIKCLMPNTSLTKILTKKKKQ